MMGSPALRRLEENTMLDVIEPPSARSLLPELPRSRGYCAVGLHMPKTNYNIGSVLRAAACFEAVMVVHTGRRYERACTDTNHTSRHKPLIRVDDLLDACPHDCEPVAVDLIEGAIPLDEFRHNTRSYYLFGPEDGTLPRRVVERCSRSIVIPAEFCLNLAAAVNVVLYDRIAKARRDRRRGGES